MALTEEIWVWITIDHEGRPDPVGAETLYEGRGIAKRFNIPLVALISEAAGEVERTLMAWGADRVRRVAQDAVPHPVIAEGRYPLQSLEGESAPRLFLFPHNANGRVISEIWSGVRGDRLLSGLGGLTIDERHFVGGRSSHGGQFEQVLKTSFSEPVVATLLPGAIGIQDGDENLSAGTVPGHTSARIIRPDRLTVEISEAERIVAFGRGAFNEGAIRLVGELAELLGAAIAGTRPAADEGWLPFARQIGLTGAIVRPQLYIAIGLSGAPYHVVGVKSPGTLVSINSDPEAPIHALADLAIVGDLNQVLPELIDQIKRDGDLKLKNKTLDRRGNVNG